VTSSIPVYGRSQPGKSPPPDSNPFSDAEFEKISTASQANSATTNRRRGFQKSRQLFLRVRKETFSVAAMCVHNPDRSAH
jgi:hypothetical protein